MDDNTTTDNNKCTCDNTEGWASYPIYSLAGGAPEEGIYCEVCDAIVK